MSGAPGQELIGKPSDEFRDLEKIRRQSLAESSQGAFLIIAVWVLGFGLLLALGVKEMGLSILVMLGVAGATGWIHKHWHQNAGGHYQNIYKRQVVPALVRSLQPGMTFISDRGIEEHTFISANLYWWGIPGLRPSIDRYMSEDLSIGYVGRTRLRVADVHAEHEKGDKGDSYGTLFRGVFIEADFHKDFRTELYLMPENYLKSASMVFSSELGERMDLENPDFEKAFVVFGQDSVEARYILTPDMQERLLLLKKVLGNDLRIAFKDSNVYIATSINKDMFDPQLSRPANCPEQIKELTQQLAACFHVVEVLDLNTRIWSKQ
jgi:hypothetical protein